MDDERQWIGLVRAVSDVFGWVYFLAWSFSFYPQPLLNWRRKSTHGLTVDFPLLNVLGFFCYTLYTTAFYFDKDIRRQYAIRNPKEPVPTVRANDVSFAVHALFLCIITYSQFWSWLWGFQRTPGKRASRITQGVFCGCIAGLIGVSWIVRSAPQNSDSPDAWMTIDIMYAASYVKLIVTTVKYVPQVISNYRAKSTAGWAIGQIQLDLLGGILSLTQLVIDSSMQSDWSGVTGNPAKFALGNISIFFDVIFMLQHYVFYSKASPEARPLLG